MGSGCGVVEETVDYLVAKGEKVGLVKVRLYRPFDSDGPAGRAAEDGARRSPCWTARRSRAPAASRSTRTWSTALAEGWARARMPKVIGGRYGLSSKEFTPADVAAVFAELAKAQPRQRFTVGIRDDVTHLSLDYDPDFSTEADDVTRAVFFGLGSDGTVSANRSSVKIIGESTPRHAQGYFVYDSRKAGSVTTSHVRFSPRPIKGSYLVHRANFVACHQFHFTERIDMLSMAVPGATFLLNSPYGPDEVWDHLPAEVQQQIIDKQLKFYVVDAYRVARDAEMGVRINTVMQTCFFKLANIIPAEEAIAQIKDADQEDLRQEGRRDDHRAEQRRGGRGPGRPARGEGARPRSPRQLHMVPPVPADAPAFVKDVLGMMIANRGDDLPVSAMPVRRHVPHRHHAVREAEHRPGHPHLGPEDLHPVRPVLAGLPARHDPHEGLRPGRAGRRPGGLPGGRLEGQGVSRLEDGHPGGAGRLHRLRAVRRRLPGQGQGAGQAQGHRHGAEAAAPGRSERANWDFFLTIPDVDRTQVKADTIKGSQLLLPLFEFSGACAGCGETPYVKLLTQFFGDRMLIGNATGCSSIYGGNLPCTPYTVEHATGTGPAWSNSLFEDCAEFGMGFRLAIDQQIEYCPRAAAAARRATGRRAGRGPARTTSRRPTRRSPQQRARVAELRRRLAAIGTPDAKNLLASADYLIRKSVWSFGGDGWAYDIGFGGLDHVFASGRDVNILVLDTEVYSNTGGQASKSTPRGAVAKFAAGGKPGRKKDLGMIAMAYGNVFVGPDLDGGQPGPRPADDPRGRVATAAPRS